jgi:translation initiation factor 2 subunit 3
MDFKNQPIMNIGMLGSVSDGKSTTVLKLTGTKTQKHSSELKRNITIKPGYANMKIYNNNGELLSCGSNQSLTGDLVHHLSFVDCPGHNELILTMLANIDLMKGAIVIVSAAEPIIKKPQLIQHLMAIKIAKMKNIIICLNKLDLVSKDIALKRKKELDQLLEKLEVIPKAIIPVCMNRNIGINNLLKEIMNIFPANKQIKTEIPQFRISRSFDVNKNNTDINNITGGILGGSLISGNLSVGDEIEIKPGIISKDDKGNIIATPIISTINSLKTDDTELESIHTGGLIGIGTNIDPFYCKNDNMIGNIVGLKGTLPRIFTNIKIKFTKQEFTKINWEPKVGEVLNLMISTLSLNAKLTNISSNILSLTLEKPACIDEDMMIVISKIINKGIYIIGYGYIYL